MDKFLRELYKLQDSKYAEFQSGLIPTVDRKNIIGVRTPELKKFAKGLRNVYENSNVNKTSKEKVANSDFKFTKKDVDKFLSSLPHKFFDENQLHVFILSEIKDFNNCILLVNKFLPYVDNWATCDQMSPKCFKKHKDDLLKHIYKWIKSKNAYIVRFAIGMLMQHFLDVDYDKEYLKIVADLNFKSNQKKSPQASALMKATSALTKGALATTKVALTVEKDSDKYYVEMMRAWYFATALAKQYNDAFIYIKSKKLEPWTNNKAIQKAVESYRVSDSHKAELKKYKV